MADKRPPYPYLSQIPDIPTQRATKVIYDRLTAVEATAAATATQLAATPAVATPTAAAPAASSSDFFDANDVLPVPHGGTGVAAVVAFAVLCGGLTGVGPLQPVSGLGTAGFVLTSNGPGALPTWQASGGGGGGTGTVTHTAGALTLNQLVVGNGAADIAVLGTLGTTTTVLHGNAAGAPTFGAVSLTADVSGTLPDARLSANVPLLNATNAFTGANSFATNPVNLLVGQIAFPAVQNPSAGANTLDDYEEGTWTPVDSSGAALTFSGVSALYVKIGRLVFVQWQLQYPVTASGAIAKVGGLPFTLSTVDGSFVPGFVNIPTPAYFYVPASNTIIEPIAQAGGANLTNTQLSGAFFEGSGSYMTTA